MSAPTPGEPFLARLVVVETPDLDAMSPNDFAKWCASSDRYEWFASIGWPEGYIYCSRSPGYAARTGYDCVRRSEGGHRGEMPAGLPAVTEGQLVAMAADVLSAVRAGRLLVPVLRKWMQRSGVRVDSEAAR